jgi:formylglycine-generating enzyme required for sulfatase activity
MASDVWALGATLYELFADDAPFGDHGGVIQKSGAEIPEIKADYSFELKQIVERCLLLDTWERPTAKMLVAWTEQHWRGEKIQFGEKPTKPKSQPEPINQPEQVNQPEQAKLHSGKKWRNVTITAAICAVLGIAAIGTILVLQAEKAKTQTEADRQARENAEAMNIEMIYVQGGTFTMGCTGEQGNDCNKDEKPAHQVTLSSFSIGKYEVTQAQWKSVMGSNPFYFKGDNLPVENVSWNDVQAFIRKLNTQAGNRYRLPTEAEWEYAARGGNQSKGYKYSGSNTLGNVAWYYDNSAYKTHPVGQKSPNELGIYDMSGNVREWCSDRYDVYSTSAQNDPVGTSGSYRVIRGGSWGSNVDCRVAYRGCNSTDKCYYGLGFRLACNSE